MLCQFSISPSPCPGQGYSKPQSSSPGLMSAAGSAWKHQSTRPSLLALCPFPQLSCLSENTLSLPHHGSEHDSGQHCHCFNPRQVTCMIDLSWAPSTPLQPHWGVLGALSILKNRLWSRKRKGKQFPSCSTDSSLKPLKEPLETAGTAGVTGRLLWQGDCPAGMAQPGAASTAGLGLCWQQDTDPSLQGRMELGSCTPQPRISRARRMEAAAENTSSSVALPQGIHSPFFMCLVILNNHSIQ